MSVVDTKLQLPIVALQRHIQQFEQSLKIYKETPSSQWNSKDSSELCTKYEDLVADLQAVIADYQDEKQESKTGKMYVKTKSTHEFDALVAANTIVKNLKQELCTAADMRQSVLP